MNFGWAKNEALLDTHIFIWWADQPEKLSTAALSALEDDDFSLTPETVPLPHNVKQFAEAV